MFEHLMTYGMTLWVAPAEPFDAGGEDTSDEGTQDDDVQDDTSDEEEFENEFAAFLAKENPELLKQYRESNKGLLNALQAEREGNKQGKKAQKELKSYKDKEEQARLDQLSKEEAANERAKAAEARAAEAEKELRQLRDNGVVSRIAGKLEFNTPEDARLYLDMGSLERTEEGELVVADVEKALKSVLKDKPYLGKTTDLGPGNHTGDDKKLDKSGTKKKNYKANQPKINI